MNDVWPKSYQELVSFTQKTRNSKYVSEENNRKHIAVNMDKDDIYHIKIDGVVIAKRITGTKRVDYLLLDETKKTAYLIELKGCHVEEAFKQLEVSHNHLKPLLPGYDIKWRLVHRSRASDVKTNSVIKYLRNHSWLRMKGTPMNERV